MDEEGALERALAELSFLRYYLPRQGLQLLSRHLPLAALRDRLPRAVGERLRLGLYPARVTDPQRVLCARRHPPWGDPAELDPERPLRPAGPPRASILLVTYNNLDLTRLCLASLQRAGAAAPFEIIAVDNASQDGTQAYLRSCERRGLLPLTVLCNRANAGFAAANNQAAARARGEVLVFLNNDTVLRPGWLDGLLAHLDRDPAIGMAGPVTNSCGNPAELGTPYADLLAMERFAAAYTAAHAGEQCELPMLALFCAAMPRALFASIGGLDERYRIGLFEDDDLSMAVRRRGRRLVVCRDVFVHHYGGAAFAQLPPGRYLRLFWENRRRFERKWGGRWAPR